MTLAEAIRDLQARVDGEFSIEGEDDCEDMRMGIKALNLLGFDIAHRLDDLSLKLLLDAERGNDE